MKLYIISNRLPVKAVAEQDTFVFSRSEGGLTTGLNSLQGNYEKHWVGWPGICTDKEEEKQDICHRLEEMNLHPIFLSHEQYKNYYEGYSNSTLWPLCHYFFAYTLYRKSFWQSYQEVNTLFCREIIRLVEPDDWVWVQDYQLMLLPEMLRQELPRLHIGYFHHIPFPSYELFRILPERAEILKGLLGADFIAFHTHDYMRHFISAAERVLHMDFSLDETRIGSRIVRVDALPMGINYDLYHNVSQQKNVWKAIERTRLLFGKHKLILSVDRLDYSKGILHRLYGFASFLEHHPEYHGKVTLAMVIVPSRDHVGSYAELKTRIDEEIGSINGRYSTMNWTPVCYFYHGFSFEELAAMYFIADIALVTPLRDGMNLVAKEYVAVKQDNPGVLVLSEMAGAAVELTDALLVNPNDTEQIENAICRALEMPFEEQKERMHRMQSIVSVQTVNKWAADFVNEWQEVAHKNKTMLLKKIGSQNMQEIQHQYLHAKKRLILLDYDGTLVPFQKRPEDASPTPQLLDTLQKLTADLLFYRYALAIVVLGIMMKMQKQSFAIKKADVLPLCIMGLLFSFSSLFLFMSYNYMDAGIASTILFVYPVLVAIIMAVVFKEKVSPVTMFSIALAFVGISLLCKSPGGQTLSLVGITFVFLSSLSYAIYIVGVNRSSLKDMPIAKLTFYVLLFGLSVYVVRLKFCTGLQPIPTPLLWVNAVSLAVFPTVISLVTMTKAIHYIGSTPTAILGALEPVTALFFGVLIFGEQLTPRIILGILMVITAVTLIIGGKTLLKKSKIRLRHTGR